MFFLAHDQHAVLEALASDLGRRFGADYRIRSASSPEAAGETRTVAADALFVLIGAEPHTRWLGDLVARATARSSGSPRRPAPAPWRSSWSTSTWTAEAAGLPGR